MVDGTKSVKSAFRSMARDIIKELYRVLVVQRLVGSISGAIGMFSGKSTGSLGLPFGLATGGSVMPGKSYLVGENGPELVIPRHSGTVVNANQTANAAGGSGGITVQNNISVTGSDAAMVRAEVAKMIPQITNATKAAVIDARLRGGQMKAAFS
jgi:phage-related minor tail protein